MRYKKIFSSGFFYMLPALFFSKNKINKMTDKQLIDVNLTQEQINDLHKHKQKYGELLSINEFYTIKSFDTQTINRLKTIIVDKNDILEEETDWKLKDKNCLLTISFIRNCNKTKSNAKDLGSLNKILLKFKFHSEKGFNFGISGFKNSGEEFYLFKTNQKIPFLFDCKSHRFLFNTYSMYLEIKNKWIFKNIIIGNFNLGSGQGLVFDNTYGFNKPFEPIKILKVQNGLKPCITGEKNKMLGIADTIEIKNFSIITFIAYNFLDANIKDNKITSAYKRLRYTNKNAIAKKDKLKEVSFGGIFIFKTYEDNFEIGLNYIKTYFSKEFQLWNGRNLDYLFQGQLNRNLSLFFRWLIGPLHLFVEYARSFKKK